MKALFKLLFGFSKKPVVWKYSIFSLLVASASLSIVGHLILHSGVEATFSSDLVQNILPNSFKNWSGIISFLTALILFSAATPVISALIFPTMAFFQVIFFSIFANAYEKNNIPSAKSLHTPMIVNVLVLLKWSIAKGIIFILLLPLFHIPILGVAVHLTLIGIWITLVFYELVARRYFGAHGYWRELKCRLPELFKAALIGVTIGYISVTILIFLSIAIPLLKPIFLLLLLAMIITTNYTISAAFLQSVYEYKDKLGSGEKLAIPNVQLVDDTVF